LDKSLATKGPSKGDEALMNGKERKLHFWLSFERLEKNVEK
jgi:hypothetical protein